MARKQKGFGFNISLGLNDFKKDCQGVSKAFDEVSRDIMDLSKGAVGAIASIGAAISGISIAAYNLGSRMDALKTSMEATWGSAKKATEQYDKLKKISENSSFGLDQLQKLDATMAALGLDSDSAAEMVSRLADLGTRGGNMETMAEALLNIKTSGVVSAKALKEFARVGIDVSDVIGMDATTALNTLMDRMNKFDGLLEGEATDIWSQIPRIVKIAEDALASLGNYVNDNFNGYLIAAGDVVSDLRDSFSSLLNDEGGLAELEEKMIDFAEAITLVAIPAIGKMAVAFAPVAIKAGAVVLVLEGIKDAMRLLRGESSILGGVFKGVFSQMASWVMALAEKVAQLNVDLMQMAMNAAAMTDSDTLYDMAAKGYDAAKAIRNNIHALRKPVDEQTDNAWAEVEDAASQSFTGQFAEALGNLVGSYEGKLGSYRPGTKGQKKQKVNRVAANSKDGATAAAVSDESLGGSLWSDLKNMYQDIKASATDCYESIRSEAEPFLDEQRRQNEYIQEGKDNWDEWNISMKGALIDGFATSITDALFASENFFQSMGESLKNLGQQILAEITKMLLLTTIFRALGISSGSIPGIQTVSSWKTGSIHDGIVQNGKIVSTDPNDYIVATKDPGSLGGKANVVVNVTNNTQSEIKTNSYFDGTREIIDIFIDGFTHNVNGVRDMVRSS